MEYIIGTCIRPGKIKTALYDKRGHYLYFQEESIDNTAPEAIAEIIAGGIVHLTGLRKAKLEDVRGVGVALHGLVDFPAGVVEKAPDLNWYQVHFRGITEARLGKPVNIDTLINCQALAEMWQGAGWGKKDLVLVDCTGRGRVRVIRNRRLERGLEDYPGPDFAPGDPEQHMKTLIPFLGQVLAQVEPEAIIVNGIGEPEDQEFWVRCNQSWLSYAGPGSPALVPAELGADAYTLGAAALILFA